MKGVIWRKTEGPKERKQAKESSKGPDYAPGLNPFAPMAMAWTHPATWRTAKARRCRVARPGRASRAPGGCGDRRRCFGPTPPVSDRLDDHLRGKKASPGSTDPLSHLAQSLWGTPARLLDSCDGGAALPRAVDDGLGPKPFGACPGSTRNRAPITAIFCTDTEVVYLSRFAKFGGYRCTFTFSTSDPPKRSTAPHRVSPDCMHACMGAAPALV